MKVLRLTGTEGLNVHITHRSVLFKQEGDMVSVLHSLNIQPCIVRHMPIHSLDVRMDKPSLGKPVELNLQTEIVSVVGWWF